MRRMVLGCAAAVLAAVVPAVTLAGNQEVAERIAQKLRGSGQMSDYKIGVKYQDGTAWLRGRGSSEEQMNAALRLTFEIASVDRVVNEMTVHETAAPQGAGGAETQADANPLREAGGPSGTDASVRTVSNEEPQELAPQISSPRQAKPLARQARAPARVAMTQSNVRGPAAMGAAPLPVHNGAAAPGNAARACYDQPSMPNYAWPSYAAYPNYAAVTYPKQYSPTAWPYIGPFYPYPQVPLGWRKVTLEWDSGWWYLDFKDQPASCWHR
jgi:hypothetical protein